MRNSFSVLVLIFTVDVTYLASDSRYTIIQLANSQLAVYLPPLFCYMVQRKVPTRLIIFGTLEVILKVLVIDLHLLSSDIF